MQQLRSNFEDLNLRLNVKSEQLSAFELEQSVHRCLFDILDGIHEGTKQSFLDLVRQRTEILVRTFIPDSDSLHIREIFWKIAD
jgi:hypothetical protein